MHRCLLPLIALGLLRFTVDPGSEGGGAPTPPPPAGPPADGGEGFPADTPVAEMTEKQQAAYWKHRSRQHERRSGENHRELEEARRRLEEALPDAERAVLAAKAEGRKAALAEIAQERVRDLVEARLSGRVTEAQLAAFLEAVPSRLVGDDGTVDRAAVAAWADTVAPPATTPPPAAGPSTAGQGRAPAQPAASGLSAGEAAYAARRKKVTA